MEENNSSTGSNSSGSKKGLIIAVIAVVVILAIAAGGFAFLNKDKLMEEASESAAVETAENQAQVTPEVTAQQQVSNATYKDGTYEATGTYSYHSGTESIKVSVTLKDNKVEEVNVTTMAKAPASKAMQADFAANYKTMVVGKDINEIKLGKVSGSSLTPIGFNAAIEDIKSQAKS